MKDGKKQIYMTAKQISEYLPWGTRTTTNMAKDGRLPHILFEGKRLFRLDEVMDAIEGVEEEGE